MKRKDTPQPGRVRCASHASSLLIFSIEASRSVRFAATQSSRPFAFSAASLPASSGWPAIALMNLSRSSQHENDTMNSTYCTFSL